MSAYGKTATKKRKPETDETPPKTAAKETIPLMEQMRKSREVINGLMKERKKLLAQLKVEREMNDQLRKETQQKDTDLVQLRRAVIAAVGEVEFKTFPKNGGQMVVVKNDVGGGDLHNVGVELLTATLKSAGVLAKVIRELRELEEPPTNSFKKPGFVKGGPAPKGDNPSLVSQLRAVMDAGTHAQKEAELHERERSVRLVVIMGSIICM